MHKRIALNNMNSDLYSKACACSCGSDSTSSIALIMLLSNKHWLPIFLVDLT